MLIHIYHIFRSRYISRHILFENKHFQIYIQYKTSKPYALGKIKINHNLFLLLSWCHDLGFWKGELLTDDSVHGTTLTFN